VGAQCQITRNAVREYLLIHNRVKLISVRLRLVTQVSVNKCSLPDPETKPAVSTARDKSCMSFKPFRLQFLLLVQNLFNDATNSDAKITNLLLQIVCYRHTKLLVWKCLTIIILFLLADSNVVEDGMVCRPAY
jgi:hypothetical protein